MAQPFKSQLFPTILLTSHTAMVVAALTTAGFLFSRKAQIMDFLSRLDVDVCQLATQAIQQIIHQ
jgi:hypothetical protein